MSDENTVGLQTDPNDISNIEKLTAAVLKLDQSLGHLATNNGGLSDLKQMMVSMQATMVTGFTEMAALSAKSGEKLVSDRKKTGEQMVADEEKAWEKMFFTAQAALSRTELAEDAATTRRLARLAAAAELRLTRDLADENKRAAALQAIIERRDVWEAESRARAAAADAAAADRQLTQDIAAENRRASALQAAIQKQDLWMAEERGRQLELEQLFQDKRTQIQLSAAEKQRVLNTSFITSPIAAQVSTAERAAVYSNLGGNAVQRFGSEAATADLAALRAQYAAMPAVTRAATEGISLHNAAMAEGHALARGLSGSLGALWLTYGSLIPLAAGAAIGASLKNIVEAGKEVEYSLKFVEALGGSTVKMDDFLRVTDGTVVSIKEAAEGMRALAQNGLNAAQSLQILPTILNLAVIGEMSVGAAALSATGVISAFGLQLGDAARVGDVFAQAAASSNTSVALMTESMKQASTVASLYHVTLEETAAGLGELAKINITGSAAGTAFTNMLTGLYAPTAKAQKALEQLKITTDDGHGGLKNSTALLGELRVALSQYNEQAQTVFLNDIFTTRGTKAATTLLNNLDEYKQRIDEAVNSTGFMSAAVAKLEDTTQGAFQRMKNEIGDSLNRAFASSSPGLQKLITDLGTLAGSDGAVKTLTAIADATLRVTNLFIDHAAAIATAATMYGVFKIASAVAASLTAVETGLLATSVAAKALAADIALVTASLGVIALAVGAAVVVWQLFISTTSDVEKSNLRIQNSIDTNIEFINRETRALEERNKAWNPVTQKFDLAPEKQIDMSAAQTAVKRAEETLAAQPAGPKGLGDQSWYDNREKGLRDLAAAQAELHAQEMAGAVLAEGLEEEKARKEKADTISQLEALVKKGETEKRINGELVAVDALGNERSRAVTQEAAGTLKQLLDNTLSTKQAQIELTAESRKYNEALKEAPPKPDKKGDNDRLKAELEKLQLSKEVLKVEQQTQDMQLKAQNKAGDLGDLGLLEAENRMAKAKVQATIDEAQASIGLVQGVENKRAAEQKYQNQLAVGRAQGAQLDVQLGVQKDDLFRKMADDEVKLQAKTLSERGAHVEAFLKEYENSYGRTIAKVESDIKYASDEGTRERLRGYLGYLDKLKQAGTTDAISKSLTEGFSRDLGSLQLTLSGLATLSKPGAGLGAIFQNAQASADAYEGSLDRLKAQQASLQSLATAHPDQPKLQEAATAEMAKLEALAEQMRGVWISVGETIGQSLTTAFGKGGTALGGLLSAQIAYQAQKDRIAAEADKADKNDPEAMAAAQAKATQGMASAQLSSYAAMSNAAKGFFKENSTGYQVMATAEKAFHIAEVAEALRSFVVKSGFLTSLLGIKLATTTEAAAAEGAYTLSSVAMSGLRAAAAGIEAAVSSMAGWPFPLNFVALGATVAAIAALGVNIAGGGGGAPPSSAVRQAQNGTGSILGDDNAKSDSIAKSLEIVAKDSGLGLAHTISMDNSLKELVAGISGLSSLLVQGTNLTSPVPGNTKGAAQNLVNNSTFQLAFGGVVGLVLNKLDQALGGIGGKIIGSIFGGAKSVDDVGLTMGAGSLGSVLSNGASLNQYTDTTTKGGWFSSDKHNTDLKGLSSEINNQFTLIFKNMADTITAGANALGLGGDAFSTKLQSFVIDIGSISTKGLTGDQIQKALETALSKLGDDMAKFGVDGLQQFQQVGEGYLQTLTRVANDYIQVGDVLHVLGKSFNVTGLAAVSLSESLILAAGGIDKLTTNTGYFVENFLTEAEKMKPISESLSSVFSKLGVSNITTIEQFKDLVLQQDLSTASGQQMYAALLNIAPQFKTMADYLADLSGVVVKSAADIRSERQSLQDQYDKLTMTPDQLTAKDRAKVSPENRDLFDQVTHLNKLADAHKALDDAYKGESQSLTTAISKSQSFSDSLEKYKSSLVLGGNSPLTPQERYLEAKSQFEKTFHAAVGGDTTAQGNLTSAADAFLAASKTANASSNQYTQDFQEVKNATEQASSWAHAQLDTAKASLDALNKQVAGLTSIDAGVKSVSQAINDLAAAGGNVGSTRQDSIETLYQSILGRHSEQAGLDFWVKALTSGMSISAIAQQFLNSQEYQKTHGNPNALPDSVTGGVGVFRGNIAPTQVDAVTAQLNAMTKAMADQAAQTQELMKQLAAMQAQASYQAAMAAAQKTADATAASADKIVNANQTKVPPK